VKRAPRCRRDRPEQRRNREGRRRYYTARWRRLRRKVLARDYGLCQQCRREGRVETGNQIDHIIRAEERPDLFYSLENLETLCGSCHSTKTIRGG
jgi:5-methylcytosine-specific restriction endonuclease McrA